MQRILNYIGGQWREPQSSNYLPVYDPSMGEVYAEVAASDGHDVEAAVVAAQDAFIEWSNSSVEQRHDVMTAIAQLIQKRSKELAAAETRDNGKPISLSQSVDIPRAAANFNFFANAITQFASEAHNNEGQAAINYTTRRPLGVVACISPWNLPLYLFTWKIAPALAAGNTVIAKPSEITPMTAYLLAEICMEAGLPAGVLNILHGEGPEIGGTLNSHPQVKAISFTGSTKVGAEIARTAAPLFKKLSLEMGGKNPSLIFADCHYQTMLEKTVASSFSNQGQICLCSSRILVEESIYEQFKKDFVTKAQELIIGDPRDKATQLGAVVSEAHLQKILGYIELGQQEGGKLLCGGQQVFPKGKENGWYVAPTVFEGLSMDCQTNQQEIFGPVVSLTPFKNEQEALTLANQSDYGLSATIWTQDLTRAHRVAHSLEAGIIWINTWLLRDLRTPFGGVKNSGVGREGGWEALRFFTEPKNICIKL